MRNFQAVRRRGAGGSAKVGAYRRPYDDEPGADQLFNAISRTWVASSDVRDAALGYRDEEFTEVTEADIRHFLESTFPDPAADRILAEPPPSAESGVLRRDLAGHVASRAVLRQSYP